MKHKSNLKLKLINSKNTKSSKSTALSYGSDDDDFEDVDGGLIRSLDNHIWFYDEISPDSAIETNILLQKIAMKNLKTASNDLYEEFNVAPIYFHINSPGGSVLDSLAVFDNLEFISEKVKVITIAEGDISSAATFLLIVGCERWMRRNAHLMIHQIRAGSWGKQNELQDMIKNVEKIGGLVENLYQKYTKIPKDVMKELLEKDLYLDAETCLEYGFIDKII